MSRLPHLLLDGAVLAAAAVSAPEVIVNVGESSRSMLQALEGAIALRRGDPVPIRLVAGPEGYVAVEESAVIHYLNGGPELPTFVPPRPFERGYRRRPTLVQNAETLAQVALVARFGEHWYRELGTPADPGSVLVTISGTVRSPGVYEMAFGTPMGDLLEAAGGATETLRALLVGGYFGAWVGAEEAMRLSLSREELRAVGCSLGSGVLIVLGESACGLRETARVIDYLAEQSARQCGPCTYGLRAVADSVAALASGAPREERDRVLRWATEIRGRGACHHPDGAVRFVASALSVFAAEIEAHRRTTCRARSAGLPLPASSISSAHAFGRQTVKPRLRVNPIACEAHGLCAEILPELIRLDDWGYPILDPTGVPANLIALAERAADACPTLALLLEDDDVSAQR